MGNVMGIPGVGAPQTAPTGQSYDPSQVTQGYGQYQQGLGDPTQSGGLSNFSPFNTAIFGNMFTQPGAPTSGVGGVGGVGGATSASPMAPTAADAQSMSAGGVLKGFLTGGGDAIGHGQLWWDLRHQQLPAQLTNSATYKKAADAAKAALNTSTAQNVVKTFQEGGKLEKAGSWLSKVWKGADKVGDAAKTVEKGSGLFGKIGKFFSSGPMKCLGKAFKFLTVIQDVGCAVKTLLGPGDWKTKMAALGTAGLSIAACVPGPWAPVCAAASIPAGMLRDKMIKGDEKIQGGASAGAAPAMNPAPQMG